MERRTRLTRSAPGRLRVNGVTLSGAMQGRGAPVVFVHGSNSDHRVWEPQRAPISREFRYVACDQRYFGIDPWPDDGAAFSAQTQIDDLAGILRELDFGPAHLVGWSMSADAVLGVALEHPALVRGAFLHEPSLRGFELDVEQAMQVREDFRAAIAPASAALRGGEPRTAVRMFMDGVNGLTGTFDALPGWLQGMAADNARTLPLQFAAPPPPRITCQDLRAIEIPVVITCGELTRTCYRTVAGAVAQCLRRGRLSWIPGARHLWPAQQPADYTAWLLDFLRGVVRQDTDD